MKFILALLLWSCAIPEEPPRETQHANPTCSVRDNISQKTILCVQFKQLGEVETEVQKRRCETVFKFRDNTSSNFDDRLEAGCSRNNLLGVCRVKEEFKTQVIFSTGYFYTTGNADDLARAREKCHADGRHEFEMSL